eukprot:1160094-Pelagomonas_calceolata.AAC.7
MHRPIGLSMQAYLPPSVVLAHPVPASPPLAPCLLQRCWKCLIVLHNIAPLPPFKHSSTHIERTYKVAVSAYKGSLAETGRPATRPSQKKLNSRTWTWKKTNCINCSEHLRNSVLLYCSRRIDFKNLHAMLHAH